MNVEAELERFIGLLEAAVDENARLARAAAEADVAHKRELAKAQLKSEVGDAKGRQAEADAACSDLYFAKRMAEAVHGSNIERLRAHRSQLSALQTLSQALRKL